MSELFLSDLLSQISIAMDVVEGQLLGATPFHGKRVALLSLAVGRLFAYTPEQLFSLAGCALLHDNALTEYILSEQPAQEQKQKWNLKTHCILGQENCRSVPFPSSIGGFILYHHERADGGGPFGRRAGEFPEEAGIIALADQLDVHFHLQTQAASHFEEIRAFIQAGAGTRFLPQVAEAALTALCPELLEAMTDERVHEAMRDGLPPLTKRLTNTEIINLSNITAKITDYKSRYTQIHTTQIANKAWYLTGIYGYPETERAQFYQAAALHDIGKLFIPTDVLEKPGALTKEEFTCIKSHVRYTWELLEPIRGFEQIAVWASDHHEKLDGSGYPFGKTGADLDFNSRMLACLDIYQAVSEPRPYHPGRSHADTMAILYQMAERGQIDPDICKDIDREFSCLEGGFAPLPALLKQRPGGTRREA